MTCCEPRQYHSPSGLAWFHARDCLVGKGQKIRNVFSDRRDTQRRTNEHAVETETKGVVIPIKRRGAVHPACKAAAADGATPCSQCSWRMDLDNDGARWFQAKLDEIGL